MKYGNDSQHMAELKTRFAGIVKEQRDEISLMKKL